MTNGTRESGGDPEHDARIRIAELEAEVATECERRRRAVAERDRDREISDAALRKVDAARAHGAREALESAADVLNDGTESGFGGDGDYADWLRARAATINPTTHADTLRAEASTKELERLRAEVNNLPHESPACAAGYLCRVCEVVSAIDNRAAELRAKGAR